MHTSTTLLLTCTACNLWCLYGTCEPGNLNERFDQVDIGAILAATLFIILLAFNSYMKGPLAYIGGKNRIADDIIRIFPDHKTYCEVFLGGGQVFFHKTPSPVEVLNDLDSDVVTFFRVCQLHHEELVRYLRFTVTSREWFDLLSAQKPELQTDIQRAARFFYLQKNAYAGLVRHRKFGYAVAERSRFNPETIPDLIENAHKRLARVQIEHLPYEEILKRYDRRETLFYLDPPYFGRKLYNHNFSEADFQKLAEHLGRVRGKFVLSLNDVPEVRQIFRRFHFREISLAYTAQRTAGKRFTELLITNYKPTEVQP